MNPKSEPTASPKSEAVINPANVHVNAFGRYRTPLDRWADKANVNAIDAFYLARIQRKVTF